MATEETGTEECIWTKLGMVTHRPCTRKYDCLTCEFDQEMQERLAKEDAKEIEAVIERFKGLPGNQRVCRYVIKGQIAYRLCTRLFQCSTCEFGQNMEDAIERRLAKLAVRRESLRKHTK